MKYAKWLATDMHAMDQLLKAVRLEVPIDVGRGKKEIP